MTPDAVQTVPNAEAPARPKGPLRNLGLVAAAVKIGPKAAAVLGKALKSAKVAKAGLAAGSAAAYAALFSWQFAAAIMAALLVHESGHVWAMRKVGMRTRGIYFVPLLGAMAVSDQAFPDRRSEAFVALAGPVVGLASALLVAGAHAATGLPILAALASWMALVNLFNLLPVNPLDGGRALKSVAFSVRTGVGLAFLVLGVVAAAILAYHLGLAIFWILLIFGALEVSSEWKQVRIARELDELARKVKCPGLRAEIDERLRPIRHKISRMTPAHALLTTAAYCALAWTLYRVMQATASVPGADVAMHILKG